MTFTGPIVMIWKTSPIDSNVFVYVTWFFKESGAPKYLEIDPNFDLKEHYCLKGGRNFNLIGSDSFGNINPFM